MGSSERISEKRFREWNDLLALSSNDLEKLARQEAREKEVLREWNEALAPYRNDVEEFARENELDIVKNRMNYPAWQMSRNQKTAGELQWTIQFGYGEREKTLGLIASAYIDTEYDDPDGDGRSSSKKIN